MQKKSLSSPNLQTNSSHSVIQWRGGVGSWNCQWLASLQRTVPIPGTLEEFHCLWRQWEPARHLTHVQEVINPDEPKPRRQIARMQFFEKRVILWPNFLQLIPGALILMIKLLDWWPKHSLIGWGNSGHSNIRKWKQSDHFPTWWHHQVSTFLLLFSF